MRNSNGGNLFDSQIPAGGYQPRRAPFFEPDKLIIAKGSMDDPERAALVERICALYPRASVIRQLDRPHNRIEVRGAGLCAQHYEGKKTLVFGVHRSSLGYSDEDGNGCPNYWHISPYGFCPYDCQYCYLAGTPGVKHSPTVKVFVNLSEILDSVRSVASGLGRPTAFYLGKLQDGMALDPLTGYSRRLVPFFAEHPYARFILLTKATCIENLLDLDHRGHTILSWSLNPPAVSSAFERCVPTPEQRLAAMRRCAEAGYPLRVVVMPIIPVTGWEEIYAGFLEALLRSVPLQRITLGQICSYSGALSLMEDKLGRANAISCRLDRRKTADGRIRFPFALRVRVYRYLIDCIRRIQASLEIGLCLEEHRTFEALDLQDAIGRCNCVI